MLIWHAHQPYWFLCMPNWHAQQPYGCFACQIGMQSIPMVVVRAVLACKTTIGLLCMPICHAQHLIGYLLCMPNFHNSE
jgi:hypothetical protein